MKIRMTARAPEVSKTFVHIGGSDFPVLIMRDDPPQTAVGLFSFNSDEGKHVEFVKDADSGVIVHEFLEVLKWAYGLKLPHDELSALAVGLADLLREFGVVFEIVLEGECCYGKPALGVTCSQCGCMMSDAGKLLWACAKHNPIERSA